MQAKHSVYLPLCAAGALPTPCPQAPKKVTALNFKPEIHPAHASHRRERATFGWHSPHCQLLQD